MRRPTHESCLKRSPRRSSSTAFERNVCSSLGLTVPANAAVSPFVTSATTPPIVKTAVNPWATEVKSVVV